VFQFEISVVRPVEIKKRPRVTPPARGQDGHPDGGEIGAHPNKKFGYANQFTPDDEHPERNVGDSGRPVTAREWSAWRAKPMALPRPNIAD
jgi:hypothetical protein